MPKATGPTFPCQTIDACRLAYETTATSFRQFGDAQGISRSVLHDLARREGWVKFERSPSDRLLGAREADKRETAIMVTRLRIGPPAPRTNDRSAPCTNLLRGIGSVGGAYPAPEPLTGEASKVEALPQTPPGAEPLDLNTYARFR
jgi:hypothetical protein